MLDLKHVPLSSIKLNQTPVIVAVRDAPVPGRHTPCGFFPKGMRANGYGRRIQQRWEIQYTDSKRWYKVYAMCLTNVASFYTSRGFSGVENAIQDFEDKKGIVQ